MCVSRLILNLRWKKPRPSAQGLLLRRMPFLGARFKKNEKHKLRHTFNVIIIILL